MRPRARGRSSGERRGQPGLEDKAKPPEIALVKDQCHCKGAIALQEQIFAESADGVKYFLEAPWAEDIAPGGGQGVLVEQFDPMNAPPRASALIDFAKTLTPEDLPKIGEKMWDISSLVKHVKSEAAPEIVE